MPRLDPLYHWTRPVATRFPELPTPTAVVLALDSYGAVLAQSLDDKPREFKEFIEGFAKSDLLKLRGNQKTETAMELSKVLAARELNKTGVFRITVAKVEPRVFPAQKEPGWRVLHAKENLKDGSLSFEVALWAYVRQDPGKVLEKIAQKKKDAE